MFPNILLVEYNGTFHGTPKQQDASTCRLTIKTGLDEQEMTSLI
jgi:hypothetical protein